MNVEKGRYNQKKGYWLLIALFLVSALPKYVVWAGLMGAVVFYILFNLRHYSPSKMPGGACYWGLFITLIVVGAFCFHPLERGYWPYLRDIIDFTSLFLYWFAASRIIKVYKYDTKTVYRIIVLYSAILSAGGLLERISGYRGASEDFSAFVSSGSVSQFTLAVGLYLVFFKPPLVGKYYFGRFLDLLVDIVLLGSFALSFSRTTILILLCLVVTGRYDRMSSIIKCALLGVAALICVSYFLPNIWTTFWDKILNSVTEISASNQWSDYNIVNNWRGYEVYSAQKCFSKYSAFSKIFGAGFGATVDVGNYAYLVTSEDTLPYLHNGYYTTLIKGGISGIILTIGYYLTMGCYYLKLNISTYEKRLCIGIVAAMAVSMAVIHGFFWGGAQLLVFYILGIVEKGEQL